MCRTKIEVQELPCLEFLMRFRENMWVSCTRCNKASVQSSRAGRQAKEEETESESDGTKKKINGTFESAVARKDVPSH